MGLVDRLTRYAYFPVSLITVSVPILCRNSVRLAGELACHFVQMGL